MKSLNKQDLQYLIVTFGLLVMIMFIREIIPFINTSISNFRHSIFALVWTVIVILLLLTALKKIENINLWQFLAGSLGVGIASSILAVLLHGGFGTNNLIEKNYVGIYGITYAFDSQTELEKSIEHKTNVFKIGDNRAGKEYDKMIERYGEASEEMFLFWQTAFAYGYVPQDIFEYSGDSSISQKVTLFFTIGPLFLLECFIRALMNSWVLMIIPIIGLMFNKRIFHKEILPFQKIIFKEEFKLPKQ